MTVLWAVEHWDEAVAENRRLVEHVRKVRNPQASGRRTYRDMARRVLYKVSQYRRREYPVVERTFMDIDTDRVDIREVNERTAAFLPTAVRYSNETITLDLSSCSRFDPSATSISVIREHRSSRTCGRQTLPDVRREPTDLLEERLEVAHAILSPQGTNRGVICRVSSNGWQISSETTTLRSSCPMTRPSQGE